MVTKKVNSLFNDHRDDETQRKTYKRGSSFLFLSIYLT
jgi:hypothetical protein